MKRLFSCYINYLTNEVDFIVLLTGCQNSAYFCIFLLSQKWNHLPGVLISVSFCCPKGGIIYPVCRTPIYTQSRGIAFLHICTDMGARS